MNETRFPDFGIPEDATFFGFDYLGASIPNYGVGVDQFHHRSEETPESGDYHGSYAPIGSEASECVPILSSFVNQPPPGPPSRSTKNIHTTYVVKYIILIFTFFVAYFSCIYIGTSISQQHCLLVLLRFLHCVSNRLAAATS